MHGLVSGVPCRPVCLRNEDDVCVFCPWCTDANADDAGRICVTSKGGCFGMAARAVPDCLVRSANGRWEKGRVMLDAGIDQWLKKR